MRLRPFLALFPLAVFAANAAAAAPKVVASIKPVHSLVAQVMEGVGEPGIIVDGAGSPHTYTLKPSQAAELEKADVIFWIGATLEPFLVKPIETLGAEASVIELSRSEGLTLLPFREGGPFDAHDHESDAGHDHEDDDAHGHAEGVHESHDHAHDAVDMHLWLDPHNARILLGEIAKALSTADPGNAAHYAANAKAAATALDELEAEIGAELAAVKGRPFVVFHDAYQYFENRFGIPAAGSITVSPEVAAGAHRVAEIRQKVGELGAVCVFSEPQFEPRLVRTVTEGTAARSGVLDPEGAEIPNGPGLYATLMRNLAGSLKNCLSAGN